MALKNISIRLTRLLNTCVLCYSIHYQPKQAYRRNGNFVALTNIRTKTIKPITIYLHGCNLEKQNVIDLSFPLHPTPRERIVIMFLYPLSSNVPSIRRKKIIMFLHFSGPSHSIKQVFLASQRDVGELTCRKTFSTSFSLSQRLLGN